MTNNLFEVEVVDSDERARSLVEQGWHFVGPTSTVGKNFYKKPLPETEGEETRTLRWAWWVSLAGLVVGTLATLAVMVWTAWIKIDPSTVPAVANSAIAALLGLVAVAVSNGDEPTPGARILLGLLAGIGVGVAFVAAIVSAATPS